VSLDAISENALLHFSMPDNTSQLEDIGNDLIDSAERTELVLTLGRIADPHRTISLLPDLVSVVLMKEHSLSFVPPGAVPNFPSRPMSREEFKPLALSIQPDHMPMKTLKSCSKRLFSSIERPVSGKSFTIRACQSSHLMAIELEENDILVWNPITTFWAIDALLIVTEG